MAEPTFLGLRTDSREWCKRTTDKLVLDWRKRQQTRAAVQTTVNQILDEGLPEIYGPKLYDEKCQRVFEHIYASYFDNGISVYSTEVAEEPPPVVPLGAVSSEPDQVTETLIGQARNDPQMFARLMEEMFGVHDTWFRPTEALLSDDETRTVSTSRRRGGT